MSGRSPLPRRPAAPRGAAPLGAALLALAAGGCGFTPLYGSPGLVPALQSVDLVVPQSRVGFLLQEQLGDALGRRDGAARYQLTCAAREVRFPRGVRVNNVANRYEINLTVDYQLRVEGGTKILLAGSAPVIVDYNSPDAPYAGVAAERDGERRAAEQAAQQIRFALARYFAGLHAGSHPVETPAPTNPAEDDTP